MTGWCHSFYFFDYGMVCLLEFWIVFFAKQVIRCAGRLAHAIISYYWWLLFNQDWGKKKN